MNKLAVGSVIVLSALLLVSCSELKKDLPPVGGTLDVHGSGWTDSTSGNFHGRAIRASNWDMVQCQTCHGRTYRGGTTGPTCRTCHNLPAGPENCITCHGSPSNPAPPPDLDGNALGTARGVGTHQVHLNGGSVSSGMFCSSCHNVPPSVYTSGHVDSPLPAEVVFNSAVAYTVTNEPTTVDYDSVSPTFTPTPVYAPDSLTCGTTYCHGYFKNGNTAFSPVWNDVSGTYGACGTCHGDPTKPTTAEKALPRIAAQGGTHPNNLACSNCHGDVVDAGARITDKTKHVNGKLNVSGQERDF